MPPPSLLEEALNVFNLLRGADEQRHALVDLLRLNLHHALRPGGALAARLLHDEAHRGALVQEAELPVGVLLVARVPIEASVEERAVEVADEGADVAGRVGLPAPQLGVLERVHVPLQALVPELVVALVEGVDLSRLGHLEVVVGEDELADRRVEGEAKDAPPDGEDEDDRGRVHAVARRQEARARLAGPDDALVHDGVGVVHVLDGALLVGVVDPKDGAGGDGGVDVGGPVQRVKHHNVVSRVCLLDGDGDVLFLGGDDARASRALEAGAEDVV
mmetsp:Transcript_2350/g.5547  ORF Transcript_2350/g.5547 Transcript_2350/m.5547 type:complete len:275 (+) Transcript_2350:289-1113(+)